MRHTQIGEKVTTNNIYTFVFIIILLQNMKEAQEVVFPSSNKVTEVDEHYFNIIKGDWSLLESETMSDTHEMINDYLENMTDNHDKMTDNQDILTDNPGKLVTISTHPGLTFSYQKIMMPKTVPEQVQGGKKYVVGLSIRKQKMDSEYLL